MILTFPVEWYPEIETQSFALRSLNQVAARPWRGAGAAISGPHTQLYVSDVSFRPMRDPLLQDMDSFFARLKGRANALRLADAKRVAPWYDRNITASSVGFSDGSLFDDGTGFANGLLPPNVFVAEAAARGANYIVLGGFPASTANVIRRGDPFEIMPNGVPAAYPHRYEAMISSSSDSSGRVGLEIGPLLRVGVAAGDQVSLRYAASLFRLVSDSEGESQTGGAGIGTRSFKAIEALDLVP